MEEGSRQSPVVPGRKAFWQASVGATPPLLLGEVKPTVLCNNHNRPVQAPRSFDREVADLHTADSTRWTLQAHRRQPGSNGGTGNPRSLHRTVTARILENETGPGLLLTDRSRAPTRRGRRPGSPVQGSTSPNRHWAFESKSAAYQTGSNTGDWRRSPNSRCTTTTSRQRSSNSPSGGGERSGSGGIGARRIGSARQQARIGGG